MHGIRIGIDPVLVQLGPLEVRWYSLFLVLAIAAGVWLGLREAQVLAFLGVAVALPFLLYRLRAGAQPVDDPLRARTPVSR